jgi:asparagine synthetase B (glutamine-hydrolysing)
MFLAAITKSEIANNLQSFAIEQFRINSSVISIVTDSFLSSFFSEPHGFSVIESPFIRNQNFGDVIFSQIKYDNKNDVFEIFRSTLSGRPIYYHINSKGELFCSTHISMLRKAGVKIEENQMVLPEFFVYRYVMPPQTLYRNITQLFAGSRLCIKFLNGKCIIKSIDKFDPPKQDKKFESVENISKQAANYLSKSIQALSPGKDRLAVLLSGGLDSSILLRICQAKYRVDTTYSTDYPFQDPRKNTEKEYALSAADTFQVKHKYYEVTNKQYLRGFLEAISAAEEPLDHPRSVLLYLLFKRGIPQDKDIVLSGHGADVVWGLGLHNVLYRSNKMLFKLLLNSPVKLLKIASRITGRARAHFIATSLRWKTSKNCPIQDPNHIVWSEAGQGAEDWVCNCFKVTRYNIIEDRYNTIKQFEGRSLYDVISLYYFLGAAACSSACWAKLGESQHKILYYPYYHPDLLNYAYSIPWDLKLGTPKNILRRVARQYDIPESIITRPKSGFGIRAERWAEKGGIVDSLIPLASKVFNEKQIRNMQSSDPKKSMTFWNILNYSVWKRLCVNNESTDVLLEELNQAMGGN